MSNLKLSRPGVIFYVCGAPNKVAYIARPNTKFGDKSFHEISSVSSPHHTIQAHGSKLQCKVQNSAQYCSQINMPRRLSHQTLMLSVILLLFFQGVTRLLLTKIPFFKEVIVMSFECPHCGYRNNEIQPGAMIQEKGIKIQVKIEGEKVSVSLVISILCCVL